MIEKTFNRDAEGFDLYISKLREIPSAMRYLDFATKNDPAKKRDVINAVSDILDAFRKYDFADGTDRMLFDLQRTMLDIKNQVDKNDERLEKLKKQVTALQNKGNRYPSLDGEAVFSAMKKYLEENTKPVVISKPTKPVDERKNTSVATKDNIDWKKLADTFSSDFDNSLWSRINAPIYDTPLEGHQIIWNVRPGQDYLISKRLFKNNDSLPTTEDGCIVTLHTSKQQSFRAIYYRDSEIGRVNGYIKKSDIGFSVK